MADIKVMHQNASIVQGMIDGIGKTMVHINFIPYITFKKALEKGLDPEKWENSKNANGNKILIEGIPYRQYIENMDKEIKIEVDLTAQTYVHPSSNKLQIGSHTFELDELGAMLNEMIETRRAKRRADIDTSNFLSALNHARSNDSKLDVKEFMKKYIK